MAVRYTGRLKQFKIRQLSNTAPVLPTWVTPEGLLFSSAETSAANATLLATGGVVTYAVTSGALPSGVSLSSDGQITGTLPPVNGPTDFDFTVTATNENGGTPRNFRITVVEMVVTWTTAAGSLFMTNEGNAISSSILATDPVGNPITYSLSNSSLPVGVTLHSNGAILGVAPAVTQDTTYTFNAIASSPYSNSVARTFSFAVADVPAPVWNVANTNLAAYGGAPVGYKLNATVPAGFTATYAVSNGALPASLTMASNGLVSGSTAYLENGAYSPATFTVRATANNGLTADQAFTYALANDPHQTNTVVALHNDLNYGTGDVSWEYGDHGYVKTVVHNGPGSYQFSGLQNTFNALPAAMNIGTKDFTIEAWLNVTSFPEGGGFGTFYCQGKPGDTLAAEAMAIKFYSPDGNVGTSMRFITRGISTGTIQFTLDANCTVTPGVWNHYAISKTGSTVRAFVNGALANSGTIAAAIGFDSGTTGSFGATQNSTATERMAGYHEDFRVTVNNGRYTASFTPPGALAPPATVWSTGRVIQIGANSVTNTALVASNTVSYTVTNGTMPTGLTLNANGLISGTATIAGTSNTTIRANNSGSGPSVEREFTFKVFNPTVMLLHMEDTAVSNTLVDSSSSGNHLAVTGGGAVSTVQEKFGSQSFFNFTTGNVLITNTVSDPAGMEFGLNDFTIEAQIYPTAMNSSAGVYSGVICNYVPGTTTDAVDWTFLIYGGGSTTINRLYFCKRNGLGGNIFAYATAPAGFNAWRHVAVSRQNGTLRFFNNGNLLTTVVESGNVAQDLRVQPGGSFQLGSYSGTLKGGGNFFATKLVGYIDEVRVTNGIARYTAGFTPPAAAFPNNA